MSSSAPQTRPLVLIALPWYSTARSSIITSVFFPTLNPAHSGSTCHLITAVPRFLLTVVCAAAVLTGCSNPSARPPERALPRSPIDALTHFLSPIIAKPEDQLVSLRSQLSGLPPAPEHENRGACVGYHSEFSSAAEVVKEAGIDTGRVQPIDCITLIPAQIPGLNSAAVSYGFPKRFQIQISDEPSFASPTLFGDYSTSDFPDPGRLPVEIRPQKDVRLQGRHVRILVTKLAGTPGQYFFALGELVVFGNGCRLLDPAHPHKVALTDSFGSHPTWRGRNLVDLQSSLGPPVGPLPSPSLGWKATPSVADDVNRSLFLDLGEVYPIEEIRLHPARPNDFPKGTSYAFPKEFSVETFTSPDLKRRSALYQSGPSDFPDPGNNPVFIPFKPHLARYIRIDILRSTPIKAAYECALSEIEVLSSGRNVALACNTVASSIDQLPLWNSAALTDGFTSTANLVDFQTWLSGLSQRRCLEEAAANASRALETRRKLGAAVLQACAASTAVIAVVAAFATRWRNKRSKQQEIQLLRERIARDLHDEVGSNLGTIAMLSQMALDSSASRPQIREDLQEIGSVATQSVEAIRDLVWLLRRESGSRTDLLSEMRITAKSLLPSVSWEFHSTESDLPTEIPFDIRRNLFLAFKEIVHNVAKHAAASRVLITLSRHHEQLRLSVSDNGQGFDPSALHPGVGIPSLRARAEANHGSVHFESSPFQGTTIHFDLPLQSKRQFLQ